MKQKTLSLIICILMFCLCLYASARGEELWEKYPECFTEVSTPAGILHREIPGCLSEVGLDDLGPGEEGTITIPPHGSVVIMMYDACNPETEKCKQVHTPFGTIWMHDIEDNDGPPPSFEPDEPEQPDNGGISAHCFIQALKK